MADKQNPTGGTTSTKRKAEGVMTGVGGVRSSEDPVADLLWVGEHLGDRRNDPQAHQRVAASSDPGRGRRRWAEDEDEPLRSAANF